MRSRLRVIAIPVAMALFSLACSDSNTGILDPQARIALPQPVEEPKHPVPDSPRVYYILPEIGGPYADLEAFRVDMETYLEEVLAAHARLEHAWIPTHIDICGAMGSITVIIIETDKPCDYLVDLGWIESPASWWLINCGVYSVWHYDFDLES